MFGKKLTGIREKAGLSRKELAEKLHVGQNTVWRWEAGQREPSIEKIQAIARALNVTTDELMNYEENKTAPAKTNPGEGVESKIADSIFGKDANREYFITMYKYSILRLHDDGNFQSVEYELVPFPHAELSPDPAHPPFMVKQGASFGLASRGVAADDRAVVINPACTQVESGRFYLISLNGEILLRQLYRAPDGGVIVEGDNAFRVEVPAASPALRILGRAVMSVRGL